MERLIEKDDQDAIIDYDADLHFALVAMSNLWRAIRVTADLTGDGAINALLARFDKELPRQKDVRDLHEHLDRYIVGKGRDSFLQAGFDAIGNGFRRPIRVMHGPDLESLFTAVRILIATDVELEMLGALDAAKAIGDEALRLLDRHLQ